MFRHLMHPNRKTLDRLSNIFDRISNICFWIVIVLVVSTDFVRINSTLLICIITPFAFVPIAYFFASLSTFNDVRAPAPVVLVEGGFDTEYSTDAEFLLLTDTVDRIRGAQTNGEIMGILAEYRLDVRQHCAQELRALNKGRK